MSSISRSTSTKAAAPSQSRVVKTVDELPANRVGEEKVWLFKGKKGDGFEYAAAPLTEIRLAGFNATSAAVGRANAPYSDAAPGKKDGLAVTLSELPTIIGAAEAGGLDASRVKYLRQVVEFAQRPGYGTTMTPDALQALKDYLANVGG